MFPRGGKRAVAALLAACLAGGAGCVSIQKPRLSVPGAKHWRVTASAWEEGHEPRLAADRDAATWWRSGPGEPQWIEVDFSREAMVCGFSLQWAAPHAVAYSVRTSLDGEHWAIGYETAGGDGDWDQVSIEPIRARYLRVVVDKGVQGTGAALAILEIKGLGDQPQARVDGALDPGAAALLDGDRATVWRSAKSAAIVEIDLRTPKPVGSLRVDWGGGGFASNVVVEISTNGTDWTSAGRIQPQTGDFDVLMGERAQPTRFVRLSFSGATSPDGFEVAGITLRGAEGAAHPWALVELAASHAAPGVYPDVFRRRQNYWAVAGGPRRGDPESLLDEWGVFAPRAQGATLTPLVLQDGQAWSAHQAAALEHRLGGDGAPMPETTWRLPSGLSLRIRALARSGVSPATTWVQYELANDSGLMQTGRLCWVVRPVRLSPPWAGGGLDPIFKIRTETAPDGWQEIQVNDAPLFAVPEAELSFGAAEFNAGDVVEYLLRGETPPARTATDDNGLASAAWWMDFALEAGEKKRMVVAAQAQEPGGPRPRRSARPGGGAEAVADAFDREWVDTSWAWRNETSRCFPKVARPDAMDGLRTQVGWLLGVRGGGGAGEDLDSIAARVAALLRAGQGAAAREWIEQVAAGVQTNGRVPAVYRPDGSPAPDPGPEGRHASQGQFAFMVMEYYRFTQDATFLHEMYPKLTNALGYLQGLRAEVEKTEWRLPDKERFLLEGLLPVSGARPGSPRPVHLYADHYWSLLGWKEMTAAASRLGLLQEAAWANEQYHALRSSVRHSLRERMDRMEAAWIPASAEEDRLDLGAVALLFWPCEEADLEPAEPGTARLVEPHELQSSLDAFYEDFLGRLQPGWDGAIPSDEAQLLVPLASMGRGDYAREVLYALLDRRHPRGWHVWPAAIGSDPRQPGVGGFMPDIRSAAAYFIGVRGLAARETGKRLNLFCGAPAEWLQHGDGFQALDMPTAFGPLDLHGYWRQNQFTVEIGGAARPPEGYRLWWPRFIAPERVLANGKHLKDFDAQGATLPHDFKGTVEAFFPYMAPWPRDP